MGRTFQVILKITSWSASGWPRFPCNLMGDISSLKGRVYPNNLPKQTNGPPSTARLFGAPGQGIAKECSHPKETPILPAARCSAITNWEGFHRGRDLQQQPPKQRQRSEHSKKPHSQHSQQVLQTTKTATTKSKLSHYIKGE